MATENQFSRRRTGSSKSSEGANLPLVTSPDQAARDRSTWISALCRQVLGAYRRDDFADPDNFLAQLGMVLERYPDSVIRECTSPVTGIQRKSKWPPSIAEVVEFCDDQLERAETIRRLGEFRTRPWEPRPTGLNRANVFVPADNARYPEMRERARKGDPLDREHSTSWRNDPERAGIWVILGWLDEEEKKPGKGFRRLTGDELRAMYGPAPAAEEAAE